MTYLITISGIFLAAALQARLPTLWWLGGVRLELLPALVVYYSLGLRRGQAIVLAFVAGMTQDALSAAPFGLSTLAYGVSALIMSSMKDILDRDLPWVQLSAGALTSVAVAVIQFCVVGISFMLLIKLCLIAVMTGMITVVVFFVLDYVRAVWGYA